MEYHFEVVFSSSSGAPLQNVRSAFCPPMVLPLKKRRAEKVGPLTEVAVVGQTGLAVSAFWLVARRRWCAMIKSGVSIKFRSTCLRSLFFLLPTSRQSMQEASAASPWHGPHGSFAGTLGPVVPGVAALPSLPPSESSRDALPALLQNSVLIFPSRSVPVVHGLPVSASLSMALI